MTDVYGGLHAWQILFIALGGVGCLTSFLMFTLRDPRDPRIDLRQVSEIWGELKKRSRFFSLVLLGLWFFELGQTAWIVWLMFYFRNTVHVHPSDTAQVMTVLVLLGPIGSVCAGFFSDKLLERCGFRWAPAAVSLFCRFAICVLQIGRTFVTDELTAFFLAGGVYLFDGAAFSTSVTMSQNAAPARSKSIVAAFFLTAVSIALLIGPPLAGLLQEVGKEKVQTFCVLLNHQF